MALGFAPLVHAASGSDTCTWTGTTDSNFSTATNWSGCSGAAPVNGDSLVFDHSIITSGNVGSGYAWSLNNDISNLSVGSITFQGSSSNGYYFTLTGNGITVTNGISVAGESDSATLPLTVSGNQTFNLTTGSLTLAAIFGSGNIAVTGSSIMTINSSPSYTGTITASSTTILTLYADTSTFDFGGSVVVDSGAVLGLADSIGTNVSFAVPLTIGGNGTALTPNGALNLTGYTGNTITLSSPITLTSNVQVTGDNSLNVTGSVTGNYTITPAAGQNVTVTTPSGTQQSATLTTTIASTDSQPTTPLSVAANNVVVLDGARGDVYVDDKGTLKGTGTANSLSVYKGAIVAPGHSPGTLTVLKTLTLSGGSTYQAELKDTAAGDYDQLVVGNASDTTGNDVTLGDNTNGDPTLDVSLYAGYKISKGDIFTIIDNLSKTAVKGTFANLPEGATFNVSGYVFKISYIGGDGNDVTLTAETVPATPDTGFGLAAAHPGGTLILTVMAAGAIFGIAQRTKRTPAKARARR